LRFKIDWVSLIVGRKFTVFALYFRAISKYKPSGGPYIRRGDLTEGSLRYEFGRLTFGGAYTWRGSLSEFYGMLYCIVKRGFVRLEKEEIQFMTQWLSSCYFWSLIPTIVPFSRSSHFTGAWIHSRHGSVQSILPSTFLSTAFLLPS